ncbi:MAG: LLM class flavin-dependent oxidoreductase [Dehalococcoidia bacterium]
MSILDRFSTVTFPLGRKLPTLDEVAKASQHAEKLGFYSINLPMVTSSFRSLDALTLLPAMVAATSTIRIAIDAIPVFLLPPFAWAKYFASLDVISGGRVIVGMCLGYGEEAFGVVGVNQKNRGKIADEQVEVITRLWTEDSVTHEGEFYTLKNAAIDPKPLQKPYPPIWWGGRTKSIPRAARYCQYLNTLWPTLDEVRNEYIPLLKQETQKWGTSTKLSTWLFCRVTPDQEMTNDEIDQWFTGVINGEVKVTPSDVSVAGSPQQCAEALKRYMEAGIDRFVLDFQRHSVDPTEAFMEQTSLFVEKVAPLLE